MSEKKEKNTAKRSKERGALAAYQTLKTEILTLELEPGAPLDEKSLSDRFSVSRTPVREALLRLSIEGWVEMLFNRSIRVRPLDLTNFPDYVLALDVMHRMHTRLASQNRTAEDLEAISAAENEFVNACERQAFSEISEADFKFHHAIARSAKNDYLFEGYEKLLGEGRRIQHLQFRHNWQHKDYWCFSEDHSLMIDAIEKQDIEKADRSAHVHVKHFHTRVIEFLQTDFSESLNFEKFV